MPDPVFDLYEAVFLKKVVADLPLGLCYVHNRTFLWVNEFMLKLLGYTFDELVAQKTRMIYESDAEFERVGKLLYQEKTGVITHVVRKDKKVIPVMIHAISQEVRSETGMFMSPHVVTFSLMTDELMQLMGTPTPTSTPVKKSETS